MAASKCWVKNPDTGAEEVYILGDAGDTATSGQVSVKLASSGQEIQVNPSDVYSANPDGLTCPDNTMLIHLSEATLLSNVRERFAAKEIYTLTGSILLAMNPFENLPIYSEQQMAQYVGKALGRAPPHVYGISETAYQMLTKTGKSQSIVVSGESGAGKTETNKHLMYYLAYRSKSSGGTERLAECILQSNPVLEAFGNAKTSRNNNSSRFGKFVKILIGKGGAIGGAKVANYLLEKSRLVYVAEGERNYHALYHLVAGAPSSLCASLGLSGGVKGFHYLNQSSVTTLPSMEDGAMFEMLTAALSTCGVSDAERDDVFACLAGILHVGNLTFSGDTASIDPCDSVGALAKTLATDVTGCLTSRSLTVGGEKTVVPLSAEKAAQARDALAKAVYVRLFDWVVAAVNRSLAAQAGGGGEAPKFVGLLDVFGFEFFGTDNSFEQLAINFANEKLQQFFLKFVFKAEETEYASENVPYTSIEYQDNQGCIDLIEKTPSGLLRILDTQCKTPKATDETFSLAVNREHKKNDFFLIPRAAGLRKFREEEAFVVRHFAGNVCYMSAGFMDKNNDTLHPDFEAALSSSTNIVLAGLFAPALSAKKKNASFNSVGRRFINDLDSLMMDLAVTHAHFIRCLKPNLQLVPKKVSPSLVLTQLRCSGTLEAVQLISASYPTRIPYEDIYGRYKEHMPDFVQKLEPAYFTEAIALACDVDEADYQLGRTKIFLKAGKGAFLEELKDRDLSEVIPMLVAKIKEWEARRVARAKLLKRVGGWTYRRLHLKKREAANKVSHQYATMRARRQHRQWQEERAKRMAEAKELEIAQRAAAAKAEAEARIAAAKDAEERKRLEAEAAVAEKAAAAEKAEAAAAARAAAERLAAEKAAAAKEAAAQRAAAKGAQTGGDAKKSASGNSGSLARARTGKGAALLMSSDRNLNAAQAAGPPAKVMQDTEFMATITRDNSGLGIEVDQVEGKPVIGAVAPKGAAAKQSAIRPGDLIIRIFEFETPSYDSAIASIRGASGPLQMTLIRRPVTKLMSLYSNIEMANASAVKRTWRAVTIEVFSNRDLKYAIKEGAGSGLIPLRDAVEIQLTDKPGGSALMDIHTPTQSYEFRSTDGAQLHTLHRRLLPLFPQLGLSIRKEGWLQKKAETGTHFAKRWCILDSSFKLSYFKDKDAEREQGTVDLAIASSVSDARGGMGFELETPGRVWTFHAESRDAQAEWMAAITAMLNDKREADKELQAAGGSVLLKGAEAAFKDDATGEWVERLWWELSSTGELKVLQAQGGSALHTVALSDVVKVDRTKGADFYAHCLDIDVELEDASADFTLTMRPNGKNEMKSWLVLLSDQMEKHAKESSSGGGGSVAVIQAGWCALRRVAENAESTEDVGRVYVKLITEQKQVEEAIAVTNTLYWFPSETASADLASGSAMDLEEVEAITEEGAALLMQSDSECQVELIPEGGSAAWLTALRAHCVNAEGYESPAPPSHGAATGAAGQKVLLSETLRMILPRQAGGEHGGSSGSAGWSSYDCELTAGGTLSFKQPGASGAIDVTRSVGVWLLGSSSLPTLDVILPGKKHTFTTAEGHARGRATLETWRKAIAELMPYKPVQELHKGWLEKQGGNTAGWKMRFFVLLSTRQFVYYESDSSTKQRGAIDLRTATAVRAIPDEFYNYDDAIEIVTSKRRWIVCPESKRDQAAWLAALAPMIGGESAAEADVERDADGDGIGAFASFHRSSNYNRAPNRASSNTGRVRGMSAVVHESEGQQGFLERLEEGEWVRRFYVLEKRVRDGRPEASLEYYMDAALTPDEDSETIHLGAGTLVRAAPSDLAQMHAIQLQLPGGAAIMLAAESAEALAKWQDALTAAAVGVGKLGKGSSAKSLLTKGVGALAKAPTSLNMGGTSSSRALLKGASDGDPAAAPLAFSSSKKMLASNLGAAGSSKLNSSRSSTASITGLAPIPDAALKLHSGYLTKKGEGVFASAQHRWFVLYRTAEIHYFDGEAINTSTHKGAIALEGVRHSDISRVRPGTNDYSFTINTPKRKWQLKAASRPDFDGWNEALRELLEH